MISVSHRHVPHKKKNSSREGLGDGGSRTSVEGRSHSPARRSSLRSERSRAQRQLAKKITKICPRSFSRRTLARVLLHHHSTPTSQSEKQTLSTTTIKKKKKRVEVKHSKCNRKRSKTPHGHVLP